jgi:hypothetical protein
MGEPLFKLGAAAKAMADDAMEALRPVLQASSKRVGVIIDESQKITEAFEKDKVEYFQGWYGWQHGPGTLFVRMDIASSHGACQRVHW